MEIRQHPLGLTLLFEHSQGRSSACLVLASKKLSLVFAKEVHQDHGVWKYQYEFGTDPKVELTWTVQRQGEGLTPVLALAEGKRENHLSKIEFYGALNRWFVQPLCTVGEELRKSLGTVLEWPRLVDLFERDCGEEGIRGDGRVLWYPKPR